MKGERTNEMKPNKANIRNASLMFTNLRSSDSINGPIIRLKTQYNSVNG
jgi:hypothetical protein